MYYQQHSYPQTQKQDPKLSKLRQDNLSLQKALKDLNECYQQKISLLQQQLKLSKQKEQTLLQWKSTYIDKQLFNNAKYQQQLQKLVTMIQEMAHNYQKDNSQHTKKLQQKDQEITHLKHSNTHLKDQNTYLRQQEHTQQLKIQALAHKYIVQIERLNNQLKELKDQVIYDEQLSRQEQFAERQDASVRDSIQTPFDEQSAREESLQHSIYDRNFTQNQQQTFEGTEQNPLKDISNKNPINLHAVVQKSTYLNGAITIQTQLHM